MPSPIEATPRWSDFQHQPGKNSSLSWDVIGATSSVEAYQANGIFRQNDNCPWDPLLSADAPTVTRPAPGLWRVVNTFSAGQGGSTQPKDPDPLKQPFKFRWNFGSTSEPFDRDVWKNLVINTAGEADESPYQKDVNTVGFTVTKNFPPSTDFAALNAQFQNKLNDKDVALLGRYKVDKHTCRCLLFSPTIEYDSSALFVPCAATFEVRKDGWRVRKKSVGRNCWYNDAASNKARFGQLYDATGNPVSTPIPLKEDGTPLNDGYGIGPTRQAPVAYPLQIPKNIEIEKADDGSVWLLYDQYEDTDFSALPF